MSEKGAHVRMDFSQRNPNGDDLQVHEYYTI